MKVFFFFFFPRGGGGGCGCGGVFVVVVLDEEVFFPFLVEVGVVAGLVEGRRRRFVVVRALGVALGLALGVALGGFRGAGRRREELGVVGAGGEVDAEGGVVVLVEELFFHAFLDFRRLLVVFQGEGRPVEGRRRRGRVAAPGRRLDAAVVLEHEAPSEAAAVAAVDANELMIPEISEEISSTVLLCVDEISVVVVSCDVVFFPRAAARYRCRVF
mmetsp:Transcript_28170/g.90800  ORF Transcript_28170/g.90800 Transcript_28170/m.90800 type:complete len:215 (+) Transcript_28170:196-840(+)